MPNSGCNLFPLYSFPISFPVFLFPVLFFPLFLVFFLFFQHFFFHVGLPVLRAILALHPSKFTLKEMIYLKFLRMANRGKKDFKARRLQVP